MVHRRWGGEEGMARRMRGVRKLGMTSLLLGVVAGGSEPSCVSCLHRFMTLVGAQTGADGSSTT